MRPANRDWACQTERCHTLSNKTCLQLIGCNSLLLLLLLFGFQPKMAQQLPLNGSNVYNHNFKTTIFTHIKSSVYLQSVANTTIKIPVHRDRAKHMNPSCRRWLIQYTVDVIIRIYKYAAFNC